MIKKIIIIKKKKFKQSFPLPHHKCKGKILVIVQTLLQPSMIIICICMGDISKLKAFCKTFINSIQIMIPMLGKYISQNANMSLVLAVAIHFMLSRVVFIRRINIIIRITITLQLILYPK
ncbi:unnamed protein product (macronuclear) [Paramecium tetraurelia]|uniref:Uncharacterized protein n=1 Tax=Paramecium tetraurelia TaxID=5888 RepID=A0BUB8_PARTE|nr:uncharacterized protein GSPATT00032367001 [Paramecium tetraurelia]CAK62135.1 unnamed protein product [Paramecium tetraurelia]|eukprot:XP_001429533.1 hypothetical protein (macronuclear) [Paramecium tetraurelia strain d4-2]